MSCAGGTRNQPNILYVTVFFYRSKWDSCARALRLNINIALDANTWRRLDLGVMIVMSLEQLLLYFAGIYGERDKQ